jgi:Ca-activated chloride channel homolog
MSFIWPVILVLLLLLPLFVMFYLRLQRQRQQVAARFGTIGLLRQAEWQRLKIRRHIPPAFFMVSLAILIIAVARPETVVSLPRIEGTVILAFDVSGSMAADDLKPNRMDAAKVAAKSFVERQPTNVRIGVVAFSESGIAVQSPTTEQEQVIASINRLSPERGTSLANGILASLNVLATGGKTALSLYSNLTPGPQPTPTNVLQGTYGSGVIVLLTDGENNVNPDPMAAVQAAVGRGVRIHSVGIGSPSGTDVHINGFTVHTQLDEATLKLISQLTGGEYYNAANEQELLKIYDNLNPQLELVPEKTELTSVFAGFGVFVLLIGAIVSLLWFGRLP